MGKDLVPMASCGGGHLYSHGRRLQREVSRAHGAIRKAEIAGPFSDASSLVFSLIFSCTSYSMC